MVVTNAFGMGIDKPNASFVIYYNTPKELLPRGKIEAHFITCFLALTLFRYLEKDLKDKFTSTEIITQLREINFLRAPREGYIPEYTRTDFTDALHDAFGFRTEYEIVTENQMKKNIQGHKKPKK